MDRVEVNSTIPAPPPLSPREQWLAERKLGIGGSDANCLFPEDTKYGCTLRLFYDKSNVPPDFERTGKEEKVLRRGTLFEDLVAAYFTEETGLKIRRQQAKVSKEYPWMRVNMDRQIVSVTRAALVAVWPNEPALLTLPEDCGPGYLECKTARDQMFRKMLRSPEEGGGIPVDYLFQVQHGLAVTGYTWGVFAVLEPGSGEFVAFPVVRQEHLIAEIVRRESRLWEAVEIGVAPSPLPTADNRCKNCLWRKTCPLNAQIAAGIVDDGGEYQADESLAEVVSDYREAKQQADEWSERVDAIKGVLTQQLGDRQHVAVPSLGLRISYAFSKPRVTWDSKGLDGLVNKLKKDNPEFAAMVANCKREGAPSRSLKVID